MSEFFQLRSFQFRSSDRSPFSKVDLSCSEGSIWAVQGGLGTGRSLFLRAVSGLLERKLTSGEIRLGGLVISHAKSSRRRNSRIFYLPSNAALSNRLCVWENLFLVERPMAHLKRVKLIQQAEQILKKSGLEDVDPFSYVYDLTTEQKQMLGLARIWIKPRQLVLIDGALKGLSVGRLDGWVQNLKAESRSSGLVLMIASSAAGPVPHLQYTHSLSFSSGSRFPQIAHIQQDSAPTSISLPAELFPPKRSTAFSGQVVLDVKNLSVRPKLRAVSFQLRQGEIVGVSSSSNEQRVDLCFALIGQRRREILSGDVLLENKSVGLLSTQDVLRAGLGFVSGYRNRFGVFMNRGIDFNIAIGHLLLSGKIRHLDHEEKKLGRHYTEVLRLSKLDSESLSGSALHPDMTQKILLGRALAMKPKVLILDEVTRGMSLEAKREYYALLRQLTDEKLALLFASSDTSEVSQFCDRVVEIGGGGGNGN